MRVAIHQPNYLPWIGFFNKMAMVDVFVLLDTVQFSKDSYTQRTRIRTKDGWNWLTIPIERKYHFKPIRDVLLPGDSKWRKKHKASIVSNYAKSGFFDGQFVEAYYGQDYHTLQAFNEAGILYVKEKLGITTKVIHASELRIDPELRSTDLLIDIVKKVGCDTYVSGMGGENYQEKERFDANGIHLEYARYQPAAYPQRWAGFEPYMGAIDLLYNLGRKIEDFIHLAAHR